MTPRSFRRPAASRQARARGTSILAAMGACVFVAPVLAGCGHAGFAVAPHGPKIAHADPGLAQAQPDRRSPAERVISSRAGQAITELTAEALYEFLLAEVALQRGQVGVATQAYLDLARRSKDARVARRATEVAMHARMPNAATEAARLWHDADPESDDALRAVSSLLVSANRLDDAEPFLRKVIGRRQGDPGESLQQLTQFLGSNSDKAGVLRIVRRLAEPHGESAGAQLAVAQAALAAKDDLLARTQARKALALKPGWEQAALVEAAVVQKDSNAAAADYLNGFLGSYPKSVTVRSTYARLLVGERRPDAAREQFKILTDENPDDANVVYDVALLAMQLEDWPLAEGHLKRLLGMEFRDRELLNLHLGQIAEEQKRYPEALERYRAVEKGEHRLGAQIRQAGVIAKQGNLDAARGLLQGASAVNPQQRVQLVVAETQLLREANRADEAFKVSEQALQKIPDNPELLYDHAMLAEKLDRVDVMEASLRKVIAVKPDHAHAYNALGYSLADRNLRLAEARELIEKAHQLAPDDFFILDSLGWVLYRQGDLEGAFRHLDRAYKGRPDAEIAAHLGEVLWKLGRREEAIRVWQEGTRKDAGNETLKKTIRQFQDATAVK